MDLKNILSQSFATYAGMTIVDRAITDVRDCLKPSARQAMYAQHLRKITHDKPFQKSIKSVASGMDLFYTHGDASLYSLLMRMGKPFTYRYPLEDIQGTYGTIVESDNQAAQRYTEMRLSYLASYLFKNIDKNTIEKWFNNYDDTEKYPAVLPSVGFYNIVNGSSGIATGLASSIPQFNLREVNEALIKLLWNPDADFDELYCAPDFATGGILLNEDEVKNSLRYGSGKACKLRAVIEYDDVENCLIVREIPFGVYTITIKHQLEKLLNDRPDCGIDRFLDSSSDVPLIKIYLQKKVNIDKILQLLYKETSLQNHYSINMTMLEDGRVPKVFGWKQALSAHLAHEELVYRNAYKYELQKLYERLHIVEGILIALANIDEVIKIIKTSTSPSAAAVALTERFGFTAVQNKAILEMRLSKLANLEVLAYKNEKVALEANINTINLILSDITLFKKEVEKGFREIIAKFGDDRRTRIMNLAMVSTDVDTEPVEKKMIYVNLTNQNNLYVYETSTLLTQRKGGVGQKVKMNNGEYIIDSFTNYNYGTLVLFSDTGNLYTYDLNQIPLNQKISIVDMLSLKGADKIIKILSVIDARYKKCIVFITKQGMIKKSLLEEYNIKKSRGVTAVKLREGDQVASILFMDTEPICMLSKNGHFLITEQEEITPVGRIALGVQGMKLEEDDYVVCARVPTAHTKEIVSVTNDGYVKRTALEEFNITGRNTKGSKIQRVEKNAMADFVLLDNESEITIVSKTALIKVPVSEIPLTSKNTLGSRGIKVQNNDIITGILKS